MSLARLNFWLRIHESWLAIHESWLPIHDFWIAGQTPWHPSETPWLGSQARWLRLLDSWPGFLDSGSASRIPGLASQILDSVSELADFRAHTQWIHTQRIGIHKLSMYSKMLSMCRCHVFVDYMLASFFMIYLEFSQFLWKHRLIGNRSKALNVKIMIIEFLVFLRKNIVLPSI